jgi:hypothetical protein
MDDERTQIDVNSQPWQSWLEHMQAECRNGRPTFSREEVRGLLYRIETLDRNLSTWQGRGTAMEREAKRYQALYRDEIVASGRHMDYAYGMSQILRWYNVATAIAAVGMVAWIGAKLFLGV